MGSWVGVLSSFCQREALRMQRNDNANFLSGLCAPRSCSASGGVCCAKPRGTLSLNQGVRMAFLLKGSVRGASGGTEVGGWGCPCTAWVRVPVPWLSVLELKAQSAFVWVTPLGPRKCRLPGAVAGMKGRLDRYRETPAARRALFLLEMVRGQRWSQHGGFRVAEKP